MKDQNQKKVLVEEVNQINSVSDLTAFDILDKNAISIKSKAQQEKSSPAKYQCSLLKFASYIEGTNGERNAIIRARKKEGSVGYPWYHVAKASIKESIEQNSHAPIFSGISKLKNSTPDLNDSNWALNKKYSIEILENYLQINLPLAFRQLKKSSFLPSTKKFRFRAMELKLNSNATIIFRAKHEGKDIVGAVVLNCVKKPFSNLQMKSATFLLNKFIEEHEVQNHETAIPSFCICIDAYGKSFVASPTGFEAGSVEKELSQAYTDFEKRWLTL